jgi:hypothetical protein
MPTDTITYEATVKLNLKVTKTDATLRHVKTILLPPPVLRKMWMERGRVNQNGNHAELNAFVQGIVSCLLLADKEGWRNRAEYRQYAVEEIDRALASATGIEPDMWGDNEN